MSAGNFLQLKGVLQNNCHEKLRKVTEETQETLEFTNRLYLRAFLDVRKL